MHYPRITPAGDSAILVEFGATYSKSVSRAVRAFDSALSDSDTEGIVETAPTLRSVLIRYDPAVTDPESLENWCNAQLAASDWFKVECTADASIWRIPVLYGGDDGPDLDETAELAGLSAAQLIDLHSTSELTVLCLGFAPGLAYLAELPEEFAVPRRRTYGRPVKAGSILVANRQTVLPATPIPTGWRSIGVTPLPTFLSYRRHPFLLAPGDRVKFEPILASEAAGFDFGPYWQRLENERP
ncbi:MAG: allophanate hydrolase subunit 1 [Rhodobacteraceae bacterium]|nr:allophanate hydrolase subunit 1 [Paracoccaceae bacterium]